MSILMGVLGGAGEALQQIGAKNQAADLQRENAMAENEQKSRLETQKMETLEAFRQTLQNAPLTRFAGIVQQKASEQVPVEAAPVTTASGQDPQLAANTAGMEDAPTSGMVGNYAELVAKAKTLPPEDQQPYLDQLKRQFGADQATAQSAVAGQMRARTSDEAFNAALESAKTSDPVAYAAARPLAADKTISVPDGGAILDAKSGKVLFQNSGKSDRQMAHEEFLAGQSKAAAAEKEKLERMRLDPLGINGAAAGAGGDGSEPTPLAQAIATGVHGDELLKLLPDAQAKTVKALTDGRMPFPSNAAMRSPYWQGMLSLVSAYDPEFDAVNYAARTATRKDFTSGKAAQSVNALNTVAGHLESLAVAADKLDNSSIPLWNMVTNGAYSAAGDPRVKQFEATKKAVVDELTRTWRGAGGSEGDIKTWASTIDAANSPGQLHGVIGQISELVESKILALQDQYRRGMGTAAEDTSFVSPTAQRAFDRMRKRAGLEPVHGSIGSANAPDAGSASSIPQGWTVVEH